MNRMAIMLFIAILVAGCTINPQESAPAESGNGSGVGQGAEAGQNTTGSPQGNATSVTDGTQPARLFTLEEVAKHNTKADCWMVIGKDVFDFSSYQNHPGGNTYAAYCGMNATEGFASKGGKGPDHSPRAYEEAAGYAIGEIGQPMPSGAGSG